MRDFGFGPVAMRAAAAVALLGTAAPMAATNAARPRQEAEAPPRAGEIAWEGTVARMPADAAEPAGAFVLRVERVVSPDGTVREPSGPRERTVRYSANTLLTHAGAVRPADRADLDHGATVSAVGVRTRDGGLSARTLRIQAGPLERRGKNLLADAADKSRWRGYVDFSVADAGIDPDPATPGAIKAIVRKTDGVANRAFVSQAPTLENGKTYTVSFRARADAPRLVPIESQADPTVYTFIGLRSAVPVDTRWRAYRETFTARGLKPGAVGVRAPIWQVGGRTGAVWLSDLVMVEGAHPLPVDARLPLPAGKSVLFHPADVHAWGLLSYDGATAALSADGAALRVVVSAAGKDAAPPTVQLYQMADLEPGRAYRLRFRARADAPREIAVQTALDRPDYRTVGLDRAVSLGPGWRSFDLTFTATTPEPGHVKAPCLLLGASAGTVWVSDVSLETAGATTGAAMPVEK